MKHLFTTLALALAFMAGAAQAELTPKQFAQLESWAAGRGYSYQTTQINTGTKCFVFNNSKSFALVPTSSDTVNEAINAFIASAATIIAMEDIAARNQARAQLVEESWKEETSSKESTIIDYTAPATGKVEYFGEPYMSQVEDTVSIVFAKLGKEHLESKLLAIKSIAAARAQKKEDASDDYLAVLTLLTFEYKLIPEAVRVSEINQEVDATE
jgi:hypothetical protein